MASSEEEYAAKKPKRTATHVDLHEWLFAKDCEPKDKIEWLIDSADFTPSWAYLTLVRECILQDGGSYYRDRNKKRRALKLLEDWLEWGPVWYCEQMGEEGGPSKLQRICAQQLAMTMFPTALETVQKHSSKSEKMDALKELIESKVPIVYYDDIHKAISDELYIFLIVYELFRRDLAELHEVPKRPTLLCLPVDDTEYRRIQMQGHEKESLCWWHKHGMSLVLNTVPWTGRVGLAKHTVLSHCLAANFLTLSATPNFHTRGDLGSFFTLHSTCLQTVLDTVTEVPLALHACMPSIHAVITGLVEFSPPCVFYLQFLVDEILPRLEGIWKWHYPTMEASSRRLDVLMERALEKRTQDDRRKVFLESLEQVVERSLQPVTDFRECLGSLIVKLKSLELVSPLHHGEVTRMRLSGDHSEEYLLRCVLLCPMVTILDLQGCANLNEVVLDAMATCCEDLRYVFLKGTKISKSSPVVAALRRRNCVVDIEGDRCRCCGHFSV
jgi:hypothetical protein